MGKLSVFETGGSWSARADLNPAKIADASGWRPCPLSVVHDVIEIAWSRASELVSPADSLSTSRVRRIDLTRDFSTHHAGLFIASLVGIRRTYATIAHLYADVRRSHASTLMVGSRSGGVVKLYDKAAERPDAPAGTVRFEATCRDWLHPAGIRHVLDMTEDSLDRLGRDRWQWSRMGTPIVPLVPAAEMVQRQRWSPSQEERVLGALVLQLAGGLTPRARRTDPRIERRINELGLTLSRESNGPCYWLDLEAGVERIGHLREWQHEASAKTR